MPRIWLVAAIVVALAPVSARAQKSNTQGFMANLHLSGASITPPKVEGEDNETGSGGGAGVRLGWGFSPNFTIYADLDAAKVTFDKTDGDFALAHIDFAVSYNFLSSSRKLRPYVEVGYSVIALGATLKNPGSPDADYVQGGGGWVAGGGINYFFSRSAALNLGLDIGSAKFEDAEIDKTKIADTGGNATTARINLGLTWYPMKR
jgi:hypothetical protein